jgi:hypothetical protein
MKTRHSTDTRIVRFMLSDAAHQILGLDDTALVWQTFPSLTHVKGSVYTASVSDLVVILDDCETRGNANSGFEHTAQDRRAMNGAARTIINALSAAGVTL